MNSSANINKPFDFPLCLLQVKKQDNLLICPLSSTNSIESTGHLVLVFFQNHLD